MADGERKGRSLRKVKQIQKPEKENFNLYYTSQDLQQGHKFVELVNVFTQLTPFPSKNIDILVRSASEILGGVCSLYNRLDDMDKSLVTWSEHNSPPDLQRKDKPEGHICYEATIKGRDKTIVLNDLDLTPYPDSDPNVKKYNLKAYLGHPVYCGEKSIGALCIVDTKTRAFNEEEIQIIKALAKAVSLEEERLKAAGELKNSEEGFRNIFNSTTDGIIIFDKEKWQVIDVNDRICEMFGRDLKDTLNINPEAFSATNEGYTKKKAKTYLKLAMEEGPQTFQWHSCKKDGTPFWIQVDLKVAIIGGIERILGIVRDIDNHVKSDIALHESEEKYRNLIQHSSDAIYLLYNRKFELINDKFQEMFGLTLEEVNAPDFDFMQLVAPESHYIIEDRMRRFAAGENIPPKYEFTALTKSGEKLEVETSVSQINYKEGIASQGIIRDITARKNLEEQVRHTQKIEAVGRLAGGVAHDFNNLLTVINGYCELLLAEDLTDTVHNKIDQIYNAGIKAGRLTSQLLAFSRKQVIQPKIVNLNVIISEMIQMLHRLLGEDIEIETSLNPYLGTIKADPGQLEQIMINLAVNARDAMPQGGRLSIKSDMIELDENYASEHLGSSAGSYIMLSMRDSGTGMDPEVQSHIFEPFFTTKERGKGTGLGLSTVYGIVKQNDGYITVESEPGIGSNFKIFLPQVIAEPVKLKDDRTINNSMLGNETILVVEDDHGVRNLTLSILSNYGYHVFEAEDGLQALGMLEENDEKIQLLLTDVIMPRMGGKELVEKVKVRFPGLKIIYCSGYTEAGMVDRGMLDPGIEFIHKPFSQQELAERVRKVLDS